MSQSWPLTEIGGFRRVRVREKKEEKAKQQATHALHARKQMVGFLIYLLLTFTIIR